MSSQQPKPVMWHTVAVICLLLGLLILAPDSVKAEEDFRLADPGLVGEDPLASIKIDSDSALSPGQLVEIPILIRNSVALGGFTLEVDFCFHNLTCYGAERGEALSDTTNHQYDWEYLSYSIVPYTDTLYRLILYGQYDLPDGHQGIPLAANADYVSLVVMKFQTPAECGPSETFFPIVFEWEWDDCSENSFSNSFGDTLLVSQDSVQYDTNYCPHGPSIVRSLEFSDGGIHAIYSSDCRGDVNVNLIPYEIADLVLFYNYLLYGDTILIDPEQQSANSDVNWDDFLWSIADCVHLGRVIQHDAAPVQEPTDPLNGTCRLWIGKEQAFPLDTVALPFGYYSTGPEGWKSIHGIALRIGYNPDELTALELDLSGTELGDWEAVGYNIKPGEIRFSATPEFITTSLSDSLTFPGSDSLLLGRIVFEIGNVDSPAFLPVSLIPDTSIDLRCNNVAGIDQEVTRMDYFFDVGGGIEIGFALRGDANGDGVIDIADVTYLINYLFLQGPAPDPMALGDADCDGVVDVADVMHLINYLFLGGQPPGC